MSSAISLWYQISRCAPAPTHGRGRSEATTAVKTNAPEKFSAYEMKDGKPNLVTYDLREGTYIIPKIMDSGYVELGQSLFAVEEISERSGVRRSHAGHVVPALLRMQGCRVVARSPVKGSFGQSRAIGVERKRNR